MKSFAQFKKEQLKNPEFKKAYDELGPEFEIVRAVIARRIKQGLSQTDLAQKMGTKQSAISRLESGTYNPSLNFLKKVAHALDAQVHIRLS